MNLQQLENDLGHNVETLEQDLIRDVRAEAVHIADPAQCGSIVRRHFDGIAMSLLGLIALFLLAASAGIAFFLR